MTDEDNKYILSPPKLMESPPSNSEFTPPDSPESTYRHSLKASDPIPIGYVVIKYQFSKRIFFEMIHKLHKESFSDF